MITQLKTIRKQQGLTMRKLASLAGIRYATLSDIENGKQDPKISTVIAIVEALGCALDIKWREG